jgi:hypothetical protein
LRLSRQALTLARGPAAEARAQWEAKAQNYRFDKEMKKRIVEIAVKVVVAALTAFLTAITTTSCMGHGPIILWIIGARSINLRASFYIQNEIVDNRTHKMGKALLLSCDWT